MSTFESLGFAVIALIMASVGLPALSICFAVAALIAAGVANLRVEWLARDLKSGQLDPQREDLERLARDLDEKA